ncbi:MAG TPA: retropepsin-like domain-containing protein [Candidatus Parabacteroides intestinavium]|nr:retropepsin-like domain-containing protein [Candidatus Parabacteroides intestinavium]
MRTFILTCIVLLFIGNANAQSAADLELAEMLNSGDMLRLNDRYPQMKDSLQVPMLARLAEANLYVNFNQPDKAEAAMADLFTHHQQELDAQTQIGMSALRAMNFLNLGQYAAGGELGGTLVAALEQQVPFEQLYSFVFMERIGKALTHSPAPFLSRPTATQQVPMRIDSVGRGHHLMIPVQVNGITKDFIFDTGCSFGNFVSEAYAKEAGLEILSDSIPVSGTQIGYVKLGVADSLCVGDMVYHHPVFLIAPPNAETDSIFSFDGVLGYHFIRDAKEIILDFEHDCFIFPEQPSEAEPNMYLSSNTPKIRIFYQQQPIDITMDSGNVKSDLGAWFKERFPEAIPQDAQERPLKRGGFGGIESFTGYVLPEITFQLGATPFTLRQVEVVNDAENRLAAGSLGADFLQAFKRVTINYDQMFVKGEK